MLDKFDVHFQNNLNDWYAGGPKANGWTREGPIVIPNMNVQICSVKKTDLDIDEILSKNRPEVYKWHIAFLENHEYIEGTKYWEEYLMPRYTDVMARERASNFLDLFNAMIAHGYDMRQPAWVADIEILGLGFRYFRFDGCHRVACAKVLGMKNVPVQLFDIKAT